MLCSNLMKLHKGKGYPYHLTIKTFKYKVIAKKKKKNRSSKLLYTRDIFRQSYLFDFIKDVPVVQCDVPVVKNK